MRLSHNGYIYLVRSPLFCVTVALIAMGIGAKRGWIDWRRMVDLSAGLEKRVESARKQKAKLERQIETFRVDRVEQERVIRRSLGYVRPDEIVIEFD